MNTNIIYQCDINSKPKQSLTNKTLVLDIDETLVRTWDSFSDLKKSKIFSDPSYYPVRNQVYILNFDDDEDDEKLWGLKRPMLYDFLKFAFQYFKNVCIWSAGTEEYVNEIVKHIFHQLPCPDLIMHRKHCDMDQDYVSKPLDKLYDLLPSASPQTTIMIDDRDDVMELNPDNGILIPSYQPSLKQIYSITKEDSLGKIKDWLLSPQVIKSIDIRNIPKNIF